MRDAHRDVAPADGDDRDGLADTPPLIDAGPSDDAGDTPTHTDGAGSGGDAANRTCDRPEDCATGPCLRADPALPGRCADLCADDDDCGPDESCLVWQNLGADFVTVCVPGELCLDGDGDGRGVGPGCVAADCDDGDSGVYVGADERCNGVDDDCDGAVDESSVDVNQACASGFEGQCSAGRTACDGGLLLCEPLRLASPESCDGVDNDCDGEIDEATDLTDSACYSGPPGTEGVGTCRGGARGCSDGRLTACEGQQLPVPELCDGLDNDCDGEVDEGGPEGGARCATALDGICAAGATACVRGEVTCLPIAEARPEVCNLVDDDCDGEIDEDWIRSGDYRSDSACGNCFNDCTTSLDFPNAFGVCAEEGTPRCELRCETAWIDLNGVLDDGCEFRLDDDAIFVSNTSEHAADNEGCGLAPGPFVEPDAHACRTIGRGIERAAAAGRSKVLVAAGRYDEQISVRSGIAILGGHSPTDWTRAPALFPTVVRDPGGSGDRKTVIINGPLDAATRLDGLVIEGGRAETAGSNSYAVWSRGAGENLTISGCEIVGGRGADGDDGASGVDGDGGVDGEAGGDAFEPVERYSCGENCAADGVALPGGRGGVKSCDGRPVDGGAGGGATCPDFDERVNSCFGCSEGVPLQLPTGAGAFGAGTDPGSGGVGGCDALIDQSCTTTCTCILPGIVDGCDRGIIGENGRSGADGRHGAGGEASSDTTGTVVDGEWRSRGGGAGANGTAGSGGGGGGAGGGVETFVTSGCAGRSGGSDLGGSGGGGGAGGCGAIGGRPGSSGGGAFGLFVALPIDTDASGLPTITGNTIRGGRGGDGGDGGAGGVGGAGGDGAEGGASGTLSSAAWCAGGGGRGGQGGDGGHGGGGGGGAGGASIGIFVDRPVALPDNAWVEENTVFSDMISGRGGDGGPSGPGGTRGGRGADGLAATANF